MGHIIQIKTDGYSVFSGRESLYELQKLLQEENYTPSKVYILVDENSLEHCLPVLVSRVSMLAGAEVIEIESGEENKNIDVCNEIWQVLSNMGADRHALLVNLGGGVITDMGGFVAGTYKRGIRFVNIPTTLLSQVDASVGGKTGIDLGNLKNMVGLFNNPEAVFIDPTFLYTLPRKQILSGFAEMLKHALICDKNYWQRLKEVDFFELDSFDEHIAHSINIKNEVVSSDPFETGRRKILNFGHTIGHAIESFSMEGDGKSLLHGEAIAIGMICEAFISHKLKLLPEQSLKEITSFIIPLYGKIPMENMSYHRIIELMRHDKKNLNGKVRFSLLNNLGDCVYDKEVNADLIIDSLNYYNRWTE